METQTPGATFYPDWQHTTSGLTGTAGVRIIRDSDGSTVTARTTSGISEAPSGSARYVATLTAPTTAGEYTIFWDDGSVTPGHVASEPLLVTYSVAGGGAPSGFDLCTLADVRLELGKKANETTEDSKIQAQITAASLAIMRYVEREFVLGGTGGDATNPDTRVLTARVTKGVVDLAPYDLQSATLIRLHAEAASPVTLTANQDYVLMPWDKRHGVYTKLKVYRGVSLTSDLSSRFGFFTVEITGSWGFPSIPADVKQAAVDTVVAWSRRSGGFSSQYNNEEEGTVERPQNLPGAVRMKLQPFERGWFA